MGVHSMEATESFMWKCLMPSEMSFQTVAFRCWRIFIQFCSFGIHVRKKNAKLLFEICLALFRSPAWPLGWWRLPCYGDLIVKRLVAARTEKWPTRLFKLVYCDIVHTERIRTVWWNMICNVFCDFFFVHFPLTSHFPLNMLLFASLSLAMR